MERLDGRVKVTGTAPYAFEQPVSDPLYLHPVQATIARGRITAIDTAAAAALTGVAAVITWENAPRLASDADKELWVLQSNEVAFRGQLIGGMTMGLSMALFEESVVDPRFGHVVNHDFAGYHIAVNADIGDLDAVWLDESDPHANPMGSRGIGEIGIVGAAAAIANAAWHATGIRVRDLPVTADKFLS